MILLYNHDLVSVKVGMSHDNCMRRHVGGEEKIPQYYVYVLESVLVLDNGITLPLLSEFLKNEEYIEGVNKQDCERKAFERLAKRLKEAFPKLKITLLVDGLYACGPVIQKCREYGWGYMIVLKEDGMKDVWREAMGLMRLNPREQFESSVGKPEATLHLGKFYRIRIRGEP
ncbi:MAG: hypothetical protein ACOX3R_03455 [Desulfitobacteriia bacterium]